MTIRELYNKTPAEWRDLPLGVATGWSSADPVQVVELTETCDGRCVILGSVVAKRFRAALAACQPPEQLPPDSPTSD